MIDQHFFKQIVMTSPTKKRKERNERELAETEAAQEYHQQLMKAISENIYLVSRTVALERVNNELT